MTFLYSFCDGFITTLISLLYRLIKIFDIKKKINSDHVIKLNNQQIYIANNVPNGNIKNKVVIYISGGFYHATSYNLTSQISEIFNNNNIIFVGLKYSINPLKINFEKLCHNIDKLVYWVYENIENYGGDKNQINFAGESSGAHICGYLIFADIIKQNFLFKYSRVKTLILFAPPVNLDNTKTVCFPWIPDKLYNHFFENDIRKYSLKKLLKDNFDTVSNNCKTNIVLIQGDRDFVVLRSDAEKYYKYLTKMNIKSTYIEIKGSHCALITSKFEKQLYKKMIEYL